MHYKNGRLAQEGDHVIAPIWRKGVIQPTAGVIHQITPGSDSCNAQVAYPSIGQVQNACVTVGHCWHLEDAAAAVEATVPKPDRAPEPEVKVAK